jgi:hypothetical protein
MMDRGHVSWDQKDLLQVNGSVQNGWVSESDYERCDRDVVSGSPWLLD